jgi:hypothetical protein
MLERKDRLRFLIKRNRLKKVFLHLNSKLSKLLGKGIGDKIVKDIDQIEFIEDEVFSRIKQRLAAGESMKFASLPEALNCTLELVSMLESQSLFLIIWMEQTHLVVELEKPDIQINLAQLWELTEGDLIVSLLNLSKGVSLEFDHFYDRDKYEVTAW